MSESLRDQILQRPNIATVPLALAGRPTLLSHPVIQKALEDLCGEDIAACFCDPVEDGAFEWLARDVSTAELRPAGSLDADAGAALSAALKALSQSIAEARCTLREREDPALRFTVQALSNVVRIPHDDCVHFNGREVRVVCWGEARSIDGVAGKCSLDDVAIRLAPQPAPPESGPAATQLDANDDDPRRRSLRSVLGGVMSAFQRSSDRRAAAGGRTGSITVTLTWDTVDDLDLSVHCPGGQRIYFANRSAGGGVLDVDMNAGGTVSERPVENIYFATTPVPGRYHVQVNNYVARQPGDPGSAYTVLLALPEGALEFDGRIRQDDEPQAVTAFDVTAEGCVSPAATREEGR